jgi:hypothetical protein
MILEGLPLSNDQPTLLQVNEVVVGWKAPRATRWARLQTQALGWTRLQMVTAPDSHSTC